MLAAAMLFYSGTRRNLSTNTRIASVPTLSNQSLVTCLQLRPTADAQSIKAGQVCIVPALNTLPTYRNLQHRGS